MNYWDSETTKKSWQRTKRKIESEWGTPISHSFTAWALLGAELATDGTNRVIDENARHCRSIGWLVPLEISVDLKILGGRVLDDGMQSNKNEQSGEYQFQEPIKIPGRRRDKHLRHPDVNDPRYRFDPEVFHGLRDLCKLKQPKMLKCFT